jgi:hypothetical protein
MMEAHLLGIEEWVFDESHGSVEIGRDPLAAYSARDSVELRIALAMVRVFLPVVVAAEREGRRWIDAFVTVQALETLHMVGFVQRGDERASRLPARCAHHSTPERDGRTRSQCR